MSLPRNRRWGLKVSLRTKSSRNIGIRTKMLAAFLAVLALLLIVGTTGTLGLRSVGGGYKNLLDRENAVLRSVLSLKDNTSLQVSAIRGYILTGDKLMLQQYDTTLTVGAEIVTEIDGLVQALSGVEGFEGTAGAWEQLCDLRLEIWETGNTILTAHAAGNQGELKDLLMGAQSHVTEFDSGCDAWANNLTNHLELQNEKINKTSGTATAAMIGISIASLIVGNVLAVSISGGLAKPIIALTTAASQAAEGSLDVEIPAVNSHDEVRSLADAFRTMMTNLVSVVGEALASARQVAATCEDLSSNAEETAAAADQISKTAEQVTEGNQQQSEIATNTATSMMQLVAAVEQVAHGAQSQMEAVQSTAEALAESDRSIASLVEMLESVGVKTENNAAAASEGGKSVNGLLDRMGRIHATTMSVSDRITELNELSAGITSIVAVIDEIASQTNLLALNAAIEAARAGEYGRGFAVVADEVRNLAERSLAETKSISDLVAKIRRAVEQTVKAIESSVAEVEAGSAVAQEAGVSLGTILTGAQETQMVVRELESAAIVLKGSSDKVGEALSKIVTVAQDNSAATEEMAASTQGVQRLIDNVASISEESAAASEEMQATTVQVSDAVARVASSSQSLSGMAHRLLESLARFKV